MENRYSAHHQVLQLPGTRCIGVSELVAPATIQPAPTGTRYIKNRIKSLATEDPDTGELGTCFSYFELCCRATCYRRTHNDVTAVAVNKGAAQYL